MVWKLTSQPHLLKYNLAMLQMQWKHMTCKPVKWSTHKCSSASSNGRNRAWEEIQHTTLGDGSCTKDQGSGWGWVIFWQQLYKLQFWIHYSLKTLFAVGWLNPINYLMNADDWLHCTSKNKLNQTRLTKTLNNAPKVHYFEAMFETNSATNTYPWLFMKYIK